MGSARIALAVGAPFARLDTGDLVIELTSLRAEDAVVLRLGKGSSGSEVRAPYTPRRAPEPILMADGSW